MQDLFLNLAMLKTTSLLLLSFLLFACSEPAKQNEPVVEKYKPTLPELYNEIVKMDSLMFVAFNEHDKEKIMTYFDSSLEFYHDKGGLAGFDKTSRDLENLFENNKTTGLKRDIIPGSLEVYPIFEYGAVETGLHRFCHMENGNELCGTFKFMHLWRNKNGQWKLTRVVSYDH